MTKTAVVRSVEYKKRAQREHPDGKQITGFLTADDSILFVFRGSDDETEILLSQNGFGAMIEIFKELTDESIRTG